MAAKHQLLTSVAVMMAGCALPSAANAQTPPPTNLVSVCSGVSLPRSAVTDVITPVINGVVTPVQTTVNPILGVVGAAIPAVPPLSIDAAGLLATAASGQPIRLQVLSTNGTLVGPGDPCNATADSFALSNPAGVSIGGNAITGLGTVGQQAAAGAPDAIAIGNLATTDATAARAVAIGTDAHVTAGATGGLALGAGATVSTAGSVALGTNSVASRGVPEVSVGSPGAERLVTNVAAGVAPTDAANVAQVNALAGGLAALAGRAVQYDSVTDDRVTLAGAAGTTLTNVAPGLVSATSTDAVNGSQLAATNQRVDANTAAIGSLGATVAANTTAINSLSIQVANGAAGPVRYSNAASPTTANGGTPSQDVTLVGAIAGAVGLHNVAAGVVGGGSTDAVNGAQLAATNAGVTAAQTTASASLIAANAAQGTANTALGVASSAQATAGAALALGQNAVQYDPGRTAVTLNPGSSTVVVHNVAAGTVASDAVNVGQLNSGLADVSSRSIAYTDQRIASLSFDIRDVRKDANAGSATALAAAGLPQAFTPGAGMIAIGGGTYGSESAVAIGFSKAFADGHTIVKLAGSRDTRGRTGASGGVGYQF